MAGTSVVTGKSSSTSQQEEVKSTSNGLWSFLSALVAGERHSDSATNGYLVAREECNLSVISKTTAVTIGTGVASDTHLMGLFLTQALTGTCVITGFPDSDDAAQSITLPAATTAGFKDFKASVNAAGALTITCSNAADDNVVLVLWRPV